MYYNQSPDKAKNTRMWQLSFFLWIAKVTYKQLEEMEKAGKQSLKITTSL
jgi:hypothetical protein